MAFLKLHGQKILFGVVCAASIALGAWGVLSGDEITRRMEIAEQLITKIEAYKTTGVNPDMIRERRSSIEKARQEFDESIKIGQDQQFNNPFYEEVLPDGTRKPKLREPVLAGVLPKIERRELAFKFKDAYAAEHAKLAERLRAKGPPTPEEYAAKDLEIRQREEAEREQAEEPWSLIELASVDSTMASARGPGGVSRAEVLPRSPEFLATLERAKSIYMYIDSGALALHPLVNERVPPDIEQVWQAQMALWIQQDVVTALARINERAADALIKAGQPQRAWVAYLPIKRLMKFAIAQRLGNGGGQNIQGTDFAPSFTNRNNNSFMFVVPLQIRLILDYRAIPDLLEELTRVGFYSPINVIYARVPPDPTQREYVYGPQPVVELTLDFEGYYLRDVFNQWIPDVLKPVLETSEAFIRKTTGRDG